MRLSSAEIKGIIEAISPFILPLHETVELRLFGSRINDALKGGDIDLLLITESPEAASKLLFEKYDLLVQIKTNIGEQKIDLKIAGKNEIKEDVFLTLIYPASVLLKKWDNE
jgi:predicted nucleotidyltransferase